MKPTHILGRATTPDGKELILYERDGAYTIRVNGLELMSSRAHGSEEALARLTLAEVNSPTQEVLVGGLGMGYTLRAVLDLVPATTRVVVAEILPAVVAWNSVELAHLAGSPLEDPRVVVEASDVRRLIGKSRDGFDAILLDVDNGPEAFTSAGNAHLYDRAGLDAIRRSLRSRGVLGVWSADPDRGFERRLAAAGFNFATHTVRARSGRKGPKHTIFVASTRS
jgi:spermidine synthase